MWLRAASATDLLSLSPGPACAPWASAEHLERESVITPARDSRIQNPRIPESSISSKDGFVVGQVEHWQGTRRAVPRENRQREADDDHRGWCRRH